MNVGANLTETLELAKQAAEAAKAKVEELKVKADTEQQEAETASQELTAANDSVTAHTSVYTAAGQKLNAKQGEYDNAAKALEAAQASGDENAIQTAQDTLDRIAKELEDIKAEVDEEYQTLLRLQQDAQTALARAEIEKQQAEKAAEDLKVAEDELAAAEAALQEAEEAVANAEAEFDTALTSQETAEADAVNLLQDVKQLTEEEAIEQGYKIIKTIEDLKAIAEDLGGKYILMGDIDLSEIDWEPIGGYDPTAEDPWANAFKGEFNGNGFSIKNLEVSAEDGDTGVGLFGATDGANITNLKLENANVSAPSDYNKTAVGALAGISRDTDIDNVAVTGKVSGHQGVGGLIGKVDDSHGFGKTTISNVTADVDVDSNFYAGGLIGKVDGTAQNSLMLTNCHTSGTVDITDQSAGGLIGEAGKTVITVNNCSSDMTLTKESDLEFDIPWIFDDSSRLGGIIGNCNGTYISICNSEFNGKLNCEDEFKGENYGWYMNDAHVSIFELQAGLPADDILNIEGIDSLEPVVDPKTGKTTYKVTVSTLPGMNRIVDMIQNNPKLASVLEFNVLFDFEGMDEIYKNTDYAQYGVVQHLYEEADGTVVNDVYIDNEVDVETEFNIGYRYIKPDEPEELPERPDPTMVEGLYKKGDKYYIETGETGGDFEGFTEVSLKFFFENQKTVVKTRLEPDEVQLRELMVDKAHSYQATIQRAIMEKYGWNPEIGAPTMDAPEYKYIKLKELRGEPLSDEEMLKLEIFELNNTIATIVAKVTRNEGCGMGGNASFLERTDAIPLEDEYGQIRYTTLDGIELRKKLDEDGNPVLDENGNVVFQTLDGEDYTGDPNSVFTINGYPKVDENNNFLYTDAEGKTVLRKDNEDGTQTFVYEDGTPYEGDVEELKQQLEEASPVDLTADLTKELDELLAQYM